MANILERRSPQNQNQMMDLATLTVTAVVDVLPQEPEFISSPIKEEEKEEQEWISLLQQHEIRPKPMKQPSKRSRPRKIVSQTVDVLPQEQDSSAPFFSCLPQYISLDAMLRLIKKEEKEDEWLPLQQSKTPEPTKQQRKRGSPSKKIISQSLSNAFVQPPQPQDDQNDTSNRKKTKKTNNMKKMNRGGVDLVFPETPKREKSRREGITRRRVTCVSPPPASSSSNFRKDYATAAHNSVPSAPPTLGLEMPGPIPDFWDLNIPDIDFFKNFFEDLPQD